MDILDILKSLIPFLPEIILALGSLLVLGLELGNAKAKALSMSLVVGTCLVALFCIVFIQPSYFFPSDAGTDSSSQLRGAGGSYLVTADINLGKILVTLVGILTVLASYRYTSTQEIAHGEYLYLILTSILGMFLLMSANDFLVLVLGLEVLSFPLYLLTGVRVTNARSCEASLKYMVMGGFSSAILVFGIALLYGALGTLGMEECISALYSRANPSLLFALVFVFVGIAFKVSLVPFHSWAPDAYEAAPTPITAFMSVAVKVTLFFVLLRFLPSFSSPIVREILALTAILSILLGNIYGLVQNNIKRLIAYSSIAHAGYILLAFLDPNWDRAIQSVQFYLINYTFMNLGVLFVLIYLTTSEKYVENLQDLKGEGLRHPWLGFVMILSLFSLAGLPPTPGFLAKFYVFQSAIAGGYIWGVVLALLATLFSLYYYGKILGVLYMEEGAETQPSPKFSWPMTIAFACVISFFFLLLSSSNLQYALYSAIF